MELKPHDIARMIDISAVQAPHGEKEIRELATYAREYRFIAVHVLPSWVPFLKELLQGEDDIFIGSPVGFPSGGNSLEVKVREAEQLIKDGVQEMDMMINIGKLISGDTAYVKEEIDTVIEAAGSVPVKVILEVYYLSEEQIKTACRLCIDGGAEFIKTSTGWAPTGATMETIRLITGFVGREIQVKAAGGIRTLDTLLEMHKLGVTRFGINVDASMEIIRESTSRKARS